MTRPDTRPRQRSPRLDGLRTRPGPQGLKEFLTTLEARLAALPVARLRAVLVAHAERLPARERATFLAIFPADLAKGPPGRSVGGHLPEHLLLGVQPLHVPTPHVDDDLVMIHEWPGPRRWRLLWSVTYGDVCLFQ